MRIKHRGTIRKLILQSCRDGVLPKDCARIFVIALSPGDYFKVIGFKNIYKAMDDGRCILSSEKQIKQDKAAGATIQFPLDETCFFFYQNCLLFHTGENVYRVKDYCEEMEIVCKLHKNGPKWPYDKF